MPAKPPALRPFALSLALCVLGSLSLAAPARANELPVIDLTVHAGHFSPQVVNVPANTEFKLRVMNKGPAVEEFESTDLNREQIVVPGRHIELYLGPLKPGRYKFFGDFHPNTARGEIVAE
ncbi:MAG: cupredoxin domain-containing protein [Gammaproteobacteria bacterium]